VGSTSRKFNEKTTLLSSDDEFQWVVNEG
jgi:hypothetical protein